MKWLCCFESRMSHILTAFYALWQRSLSFVIPGLSRLPIMILHSSQGLRDSSRSRSWAWAPRLHRSGTPQAQRLPASAVMGWRSSSALLFLALLLLLFLSSKLLKASCSEHASQLFKILRALLKQCYFPRKGGRRGICGGYI